MFGFKTSRNELPDSLCQLSSSIQVRYRKGPLSQRSAHEEQYAQTNTNPNPDPNRYTGGAVMTLMLGYRSLYITWQ